MRIDGINLYSAADVSVGAVNYVELTLDPEAPQSHYILEQAFGLDVADVVPLSSGGYSTDRYFDMVMKPRTIALKIRLNPYIYGSTEEPPHPSELRDNLYKLISHSRTSLVELRLMFEGNPVAYIQGFIRRFESDIFTSSPLIQITIECHYPYFQSIAPEEFTGLGPNPSILDELSTAPHGFEMVILFTGSVPTSFTIQGKYGTVEWPFKILRDSGDPFVADDLLYFSSVYGHKYLYMERGTSTTPLIDTISSTQSLWPILFPGTTHLEMSSSSIDVILISHYNHYWGV